ncbi:alanine--tRNA ligase [Campylobacter troglodytis]|uniref:alanine--tRNA ligase n=1 Tax=Campylobacter troglodytis TaxID=654363 RepID=UPI0011588804|nr:alanine--tRNA ligase [Campylobacter troglodytis]TQR60320.1 alanine--tRNA ligase [Campylobacter troglodytis]
MDIRKEFLDFFASKTHSIVSSSPLVPDDASLLFTNAGMVPFKSIFTGEIPRPKPPRATSCQTCIRAGGKHNDLDNVGYTARHHTFFEMLGNFSFGDYFKKEAIDLAWEFVTKVLGFDEDLLYITVHESDDEALELWKKYVNPSKIKKMGDKDNFWQMGETGPCGPCSEIYVDQGERYFNGSEDYFGGEGDRFLEIWNLVFMQYERSKDGTLTPLPKPSIDTGMGLERVYALKEKKINNFDTSLFAPLMSCIEKITKEKYYSDEDYLEKEAEFNKQMKGKREEILDTKRLKLTEIKNNQAHFRVIADHARSVAFLLAQGLSFDKEGRGYVLRRILRRAVRHGYLLGLKKPFLCEVVGAVCESMGGHYGYLLERKNTIMKQCKDEEARFFDTIEAGMTLFKEAHSKMLKKREFKSSDGKKVLKFSGEIAFKLYDTYGFPLDLTQDMLRDYSSDDVKMEVDLEGFEKCMSEQKSRSKASWKGSGDKAVNGDFKELLEEFGENEFIGYEFLESKSKVLALLDANFNSTKSLKFGSTGWVMLDKTPFYATSGGQVGDTGLIGQNEVLSTQKFFGLNLSEVKISEDLRVKDNIKATVNQAKRKEISSHHSATHLLHYALREILGTHIAQAGSLVEFNKLRFDFTHPKALNEEELENIENLVNECIARDDELILELMSLEDAKKSGAIALFNEKYKDMVRVVTLGKSKELCGGTHVKNTAQIGSFYLVKEGGVSAGIRRIEAVASKAALTYAKTFMTQIESLKSELKNSDLLASIKRIKAENVELKNKLKNASKSELASLDMNGVQVCVARLDEGDIKTRIDEFKNAYAKAIILLFQLKEEKITLACGVKNASLRADELVKQVALILGGSGGGRADFATAGGKDINKLEEAMMLGLKLIEDSL